MSSSPKRARSAHAVPERGGAPQGVSGVSPLPAAEVRGDGVPALDLPGAGTQPPDLTHTALWPLPEAIALRVFGLLSVEERLRARAVSPAWCAALQSPLLWREVDLFDLQDSPAERCARVLSVVSRLSAGGMLELRLALPEYRGAQASLNDALMHIANANAAALRLLDVSYSGISYNTVSRVLERCPALTSFTLAQYEHSLASADDALRLAALLSGGGFYAPFRVCALQLNSTDHTNGLSVALERHTSLRELRLLSSSRNSSNQDIVALACAAARAGAVDFEFLGLVDGRSFTQAAAAALLSDLKHMQRLKVSFGIGERGDAWVPQFATALRSHRALRALTLDLVTFDEHNVELIRAMMGHDSLEELTLQYGNVYTAGPLTALAELLAARSALTHMTLFSMFIEQSDLLVILKGLKSPNARLEFLDVSESVDVAPDFYVTAHFAARDFCRAILRCASLREVRLVDPDNDDADDALVEVERAINLLLQAKHVSDEEEEDE
jgi:hypothetical protein